MPPSELDRGSPDPDARARVAVVRQRPWWRHLWALAPAVALAELVAQARVAWRVPRARDWQEARVVIARARREGDLVASAPWWTDPLARMHFGDMIPLRDAARPDATRYRRALVATAYGLEHPDFVGWNESSTTRVGRLTVRVLENPDPVQVHYDFVDHLRPPDATVARVGDSREECAWTTGEFVAGGGLSQGALAPPERFRCTESWNYVGVTYIEDLQHRGRRCLWSHPVGGAAMVTRYARVPLGTLLRGHHGIAYEAERGDDHGQSFAGPDGGPVVLTVRVDDTEVGRSTHVDGEGWKAFEFDTRAYAGTEHAVSFEVRAAFAGMRHYCFEGDTRTPAGSRPSERRR